MNKRRNEQIRVWIQFLRMNELTNEQTKEWMYELEFEYSSLGRVSLSVYSHLCILHWLSISDRINDKITVWFIMHCMPVRHRIHCWLIYIEILGVGSSRIISHFSCKGVVACFLWYLYRRIRSSLVDSQWKLKFKVSHNPLLVK